jgi:hypothetical protein
MIRCLHTNQSSVGITTSKSAWASHAHVHTFNMAKRGNENAIVLPEPVGAQASTDRPVNSAGMACICIGVGSTNPKSLVTASTSGPNVPVAKLFAVDAMSANLSLSLRRQARWCNPPYLGSSSPVSQSCAKDWIGDGISEP